MLPPSDGAVWITFLPNDYEPPEGERLGRVHWSLQPIGKEHGDLQTAGTQQMCG